MKVWVVTAVWSASYSNDYVTVDRVFASEKAAAIYVAEKIAAPVLSYARPNYEIEEYEVEGTGPTNL